MDGDAASGEGGGGADIDPLLLGSKLEFGSAKLESDLRSAPLLAGTPHHLLRVVSAAMATGRSRSGTLPVVGSGVPAALLRGLRAVVLDEADLLLR